MDWKVGFDLQNPRSKLRGRRWFVLQNDGLVTIGFVLQKGFWG
jgi:hypothetical protein